MRRAAGYALTGEIREPELLFLYGTGRNGKAERQCPAPCRRKPHLRTHPQALCIEGIGKDQPAILGQQLDRKGRIHRPEEPVALVRIAVPLAVGLEIGRAGLAFHHPEFALWGARHQVDPQPLGRHQLRHRGKALRRQRPGDAACQTLPSRHPGRRRARERRGECIGGPEIGMNNAGTSSKPCR